MTSKSDKQITNRSNRKMDPLVRKWRDDTAGGKVSICDGKLR